MIILNKRNIKTIYFNKLLNYKKYKLFKIIKALNNFVYKLKLLTSINNIYLIFYL